MTERCTGSMIARAPSRRAWRNRRVDSPRVRPQLEYLEDRCVPALVTWVNAAGGNWLDKDNWMDASGVHRLPAIGDDVVIDTPGVVVTYSRTTTRVKSLICLETLRITGGTLDLLGDSTIANLELQGNASLTSRVDLDILENFAWKAGTITGGGTLDLAGTTAITENATKILDRLKLTNTGTIVWTQGRIRGLNKAALENHLGGVFTLAASNRLEMPVANLGRLNVLTTGVARVIGAITNVGEIYVQAGQLEATGFVQSSGTTMLAGGSLKSTAPLVFNGGQLLGGGTIDGSVANNAARIAPGGDKVLVVTGNYLQGSGATLAMTLVGSASSGIYDQLIVQGTATLGGTLEVKVSKPWPTVNDRFLLMTATNMQGAFTVKSTAVPNITLSPQYNATSMELVALQGPTIQTNGPDQSYVNNTSLGTYAIDVNVPTYEVQGIREIGLASSLASAANTMLATLLQSTLSVTGVLGVSGNTRGFDGQSSSESAQATGRIAGLSSSAATSSGDRGATARKADSSGLADELFAAYPLAFPDLQLPAEEEVLAADDIAQTLLLGGRAQITPQAGSQLSVVATLGTGEEGVARKEEAEESPLGGLFLSPLGLGDSSTLAALASPLGPLVELPVPPEPAIRTGAREKPARMSLGRGVMLAVATCAGVVATHARRVRGRMGPAV